LRTGDVHRHDRQYRTVHSHRDRNIFKRDTVEQNFHIGDAIDSHAGLAHITNDARVVRVVAAMSGEIEGHRETRLPRLQVLSVEGVGFFCGGKTGVLTYGPWAARIHGRPGPTDKGRQAGQRIQVRESFEIFGRVQWLDRDALGRIPGQFFGRLAFAFFAGERSPVVERFFRRLLHFSSCSSSTLCKPQNLQQSGRYRVYGRLGAYYQEMPAWLPSQKI
jgi:hypothetical protein